MSEVRYHFACFWLILMSMKMTHGHEFADRFGLALDEATARKIRANPSLIERARANLARWRQRNGGALAPPREEWKRVLRFLTPDQIADFLVNRGPMAARLSQSSPFAGVLTEDERQAILCEHATGAA